MNSFHCRLLLAAGVAFLSPAKADSSAWGDWSKWGDQKDGTYRNPVLPGDYSDLDCTRVGDDYYAISSTFQYSPGMKSTWGLDGRSRYAFSTDCRIFTGFGSPYQLSWGFYRGDRIGIYNFNNKQEGGYLDVDFLIYHYDSPAGGGHTPARE